MEETGRFRFLLKLPKEPPPLSSVALLKLINMLDNVSLLNYLDAKEN